MKVDQHSQQALDGMSEEGDDFADAPAVHASTLGVALQPIAHPPPEAEKVKAVREALGAAGGEGWVTEDCIHRYLRAENGKPALAAERIHATLAWRRDSQPDNVECTECLKDHRSHDARFIGSDRHGRPCIYSCFAASKAREPKALLAHFISLLEACIQKMPGHVETLIWLVDFTGFSVKEAMDPRFSINLVQLLQAHYPERMACIICLGAPKAFSGLWSAVKSLMKENTRRKIMFVKGHEQVCEMPEQLPSRLKLTVKNSENAY